MPAPHKHPEISNPSLVLALLHARNLEFVRDRSSLGWNLVFPILMVIGLAFVFSGPGQPLFNVREVVLTLK